MAKFKGPDDGSIGIREFTAWLSNRFQSNFSPKYNVSSLFEVCEANGTTLNQGDFIKPHSMSELYEAKAGYEAWEHDQIPLYCDLAWSNFNQPRKNHTTEVFSAPLYRENTGTIYNGDGRWVTYTVRSYYQDSSTTSFASRGNPTRDVFYIPQLPEVEAVSLPVYCFSMNAWIDLSWISKPHVGAANPHGGFNDPERIGPWRFFNTPISSGGYAGLAADDQVGTTKATHWVWDTPQSNSGWWGANWMRVDIPSYALTKTFKEAYLFNLEKVVFSQYPASMMGARDRPHDFYNRTNRLSGFGAPFFADAYEDLNMNLSDEENHKLKLVDPGIDITDSAERILISDKDIKFTADTHGSWDGMYEQTWMIKTPLGEEYEPGKRYISKNPITWYSDAVNHGQGYFEVCLGNALKHHIERYEGNMGVVSYRVVNEDGDVEFSSGSSNTTSGIASKKAEAIEFWEEKHYTKHDYYMNNGNYGHPDGWDIGYYLKGRVAHRKSWTACQNFKWRDDGNDYNAIPWSSNYQFLHQGQSNHSHYRRSMLVHGWANTHFWKDWNNYHEEANYQPNQYVYFGGSMWKSKISTPAGNSPVDWPDEKNEDGSSKEENDYWIRTADLTPKNKFLPAHGQASQGLRLNVDYMIDLAVEEKVQIEMAARYWEKIVTTRMDIDVHILPHFRSIGVGGVLASAGPLNQFSEPYGLNGQYAKITKMQVFLDTEDLYGVGAQGKHLINNPVVNGATGLFYVMFHEIAHGLGLGTMWNWDGRSGNTVVGDYGDRYQFIKTDQYGAQYTGANVLREYKAAVDAAAQVKVYNPITQDFQINDIGQYRSILYTDGVPVEETGTENTLFSIDYGGHFAEYAKRSGNKINPTFGGEILSPFYDYDNAPISRLTIAALQDLGYNVNYDYAQSTPVLTGYSSTEFWTRYYYKVYNDDQRSQYASLEAFISAVTFSSGSQLNTSPGLKVKTRHCCCSTLH